MTHSEISRRDALKIGGFAAAALAIPLTVPLRAASVSRLDASKIQPYLTTFEAPPRAVPIQSGATRPDGSSALPEKWSSGVDFHRLSQTQFTAEILKGVKTPLWGYAFHSYDASGKETITPSVPGPTILATRNRKVVVRQINRLPEKHPALGYDSWTSTHLHGSPSKPQFDGYASDITQVGEWKDYEYENHMTARTLWYHDHGVHHTAENAYMGLAAQYICRDPGADTSGITLPSTYGVDDFPLVISDKAFAASGALLFDDQGHSSTFGDVVTVNGKAWPVMNVEPKVYRFRMLNASVSRGYRVAMSDGRPMVLIGTDAGLIPKVRHLKDFRIGMAERYEVLIDFSSAAGRTVDMLNKGVPNTPNFDHTGKIMRFKVASSASTPSVKLPADGAPLFAAAPAMDQDLPLSSPVAAKRLLELTRNNGEWTVGPYTWEEVIESKYTKAFANPQQNTVEKWTVKNSSGGWFHPVHIHLVDFRVISRNGGPPHPWEAGGKDVIYVGENESVDLLMRFNADDHGRYMIHCHNLTHEDHDMMTQFMVGPPEVPDATWEDGTRYESDCDPIYAAHPTKAPEV